MFFRQMFFTVLLLFCATLQAFAFSVPSPRILNGTDVGIAEIPFIVSIRYDKWHMCGGTILDEQFILTAAHCLHQKEVGRVSILAGTVRLDFDEIDEGIKIKAWIMHEKFDYSARSGLPNDIAIMKLAEKLEFSPTILPVYLPKSDWVTDAGKALIVAGWGTEYVGGPIMRELKKATLYAMKDEDCKKSYKDRFNNLYHQCAENMPHYAECHGDSGGPLFVEKTSTLVGVVSWSSKPCGWFPGVFTKVVNYLDWIEDAKYSLSNWN